MSLIFWSVSFQGFHSLVKWIEHSGPNKTWTWLNKYLTMLPCAKSARLSNPLPRILRWNKRFEGSIMGIHCWQSTSSAKVCTHVFCVEWYRLLLCWLFSQLKAIQPCLLLVVKWFCLLSKQNKCCGNYAAFISVQLVDPAQTQSDQTKSLYLAAFEPTQTQL